MKSLSFLLIAGVFLITGTEAVAQNKYIGAKMCGMCHRTDKQGKQLDIWKASKHAKTFDVLSSPKAVEIAKAKGIANAAEAKECLECHVTVSDAKLMDKSFDMKEGIQCEACHGAGSAYKTITLMKDHAKAVAAGMSDFSVKGAAEKRCKTCHNEKSPTFKGFEFDKMWAKIEHKVPKAG
ncbi:MAG: hypothetical protein A3H45_04160 [Ignavibacteria bacterium RIFCSPLOWO2_02_FULL_55_14]|nr:MAG: hypothetical protein A3C56_06165 [Ignavibacteria bacterium RIFCSPHIGHO2_02_FULL_56_12]OGU69067.1 MAG: hypothetical protein A3H45_04160 [Ignavibacteria bacterium RIFCSPLOWO2_02_FULL_55_14]